MILWPETSQILLGVPVWQLGPERRYPGLAYINFPGNVGGPQALAEIVTMLKPGSIVRLG